MFAYGAGPVPPRRPGHRTGQHLHRLGQAAAQGRRRHRLRGRPDRDRDPGRRHRRRGVRRRRPDQPGRARPDGGLGAGHRLAAPGRRGRGRAGQAGRGHQARRADPHRAVRASSPASCSSTTSTQGLEVVNAYAAEHLEIQTARRRAPTPRGSATPARSSSARGRRSRSATTAPAPTTCCPRRAAPATPRACRCGRSCARCTSSSTTRDALERGRRPRDDAGRGRGPARSRRRGPRARSSERVTGMPETWPPLREELRGVEPYGAPQLDVPVAAQRQREPLPALAGGRRRHRRRGRGGGRAR